MTGIVSEGAKSGEIANGEEVAHRVVPEGEARGVSVKPSDLLAPSVVDRSRDLPFRIRRSQASARSVVDKGLASSESIDLPVPPLQQLTQIFRDSGLYQQNFVWNLAFVPQFF